jgi:DNA-binding LacI/PurR family transcriptional regulator
MATLRDVARVAGVHPTTASSILNGSSGNSRYSEETRATVNRAAKRLGYAQNRIASSLRTKRTGTVGLVAGNIQNPFFAALSLQLERHLQEQRYELVLTCHGTDSAQDEGDLAQTLLARSVDGLLIWSEHRDGRTPQMPRGSTTPRVWMGYGPKNEATVMIDIKKGIELALGHFRETGCRRLGYYAPTYAQKAGLPKSRPDLLDEACRKFGLPPPVKLFFPDESWNLEAAVQRAFPLIAIARSTGVDAIIGYNDVSAVAWRIAAGERNFSCRVIGFDGSPFIRAWRPRLPYVDLHTDAVARAAILLLDGLIRGEKRLARREVVSPTFVGAEEE